MIVIQFLSESIRRKTSRERICSRKTPVFRITVISRYLALVFFVLLPFLGGWIGYTYAPEKVVEVDRVIIKEVVPMDYLNPSQVHEAVELFRDEQFKFEFALPIDWASSSIAEAGVANKGYVLYSFYISPDFLNRFPEVPSDCVGFCEMAERIERGSRLSYKAPQSVNSSLNVGSGFLTFMKSFCQSDLCKEVVIDGKVGILYTKIMNGHKYSRVTLVRDSQMYEFIFESALDDSDSEKTLETFISSFKSFYY